MILKKCSHPSNTLFTHDLDSLAELPVYFILESWPLKPNLLHLKHFIMWSLQMLLYSSLTSFKDSAQFNRYFPWIYQVIMNINCYMWWDTVAIMEPVEKYKAIYSCPKWPQIAISLNFDLWFFFPRILARLIQLIFKLLISIYWTDFMCIRLRWTQRWKNRYFYYFK